MNLTEIYRQQQQNRLEQKIKDMYPGVDYEKFQEALRNLANTITEAMKPVMDSLQQFAEGFCHTMEQVFGPIRESIAKTLRIDFTRSYTEPIIDKRNTIHRYKFNRV